MSDRSQPTIAVIGLGYVGLPLAIALARHFPVIGLDSDASRIAELERGEDRTREVGSDALRDSAAHFTDRPGDLQDIDVFIVTVPTPVDDANAPDLGALLSATRTVAGLIDPERRPVVIYESTVYPGVTEGICGPEIEKTGGLRRGEHFFLGYSPERINPGDREHRLETIVKVVAGENESVTDRLAAIYGAVTEAGIFRAASIKTAEAAKVIENAQRDINIAFMNEIARVFAPLGISTWDVLEAAGTKWNFLPFRPGLVGGHCIGVDPYYLAHCAEMLGHDPQVILSGRSINDSMGKWVADRLHERRGGKAGSVLVLGLTFKEDVPDLRNSRVVDVIGRLEELGHEVTVHDPLADPGAARREHGRDIVQALPADAFDILLAAVPHKAYRELADDRIAALASESGLIADLTGLWRDRALANRERWTL